MDGTLPLPLALQTKRLNFFERYLSLWAWWKCRSCCPSVRSATEPEIGLQLKPPFDRVPLNREGCHDASSYPVSLHREFSQESDG